LVEIAEVARLAAGMAAVRRTAPHGLAEWRYHGRLVARQLDDVHLVIRADFEYRDLILAVGLGAAERGNPPGKFARYYAEARRRGFPPPSPGR
jgi:hypothetical protein